MANNSSGSIRIATLMAQVSQSQNGPAEGTKVTILKRATNNGVNSTCVGHTGTVLMQRGGGDILVECGCGRSRWSLEEGDYMIGEKKKEAPKPKNIDFSHLDKVVIEPQSKNEILSVLKQHKNADKLFNEWGLGEVIEYGKGMTFMFYGPPGTGKTWAAHCMAKALDTELLTIGQAEIQSSEPGAANRNIQNAFAEAKAKGKVLFIDECDSLITNRADLGMILAGEVNTLLTEIEKCEGVVILATNRIEHMDEALERRLSLIVEFPAPELAARKDIWSRMLPKKMPIGADVTIDVLAATPLTGGQIKNVVLQAARLALAEGSKRVEKKYFDVAMARVTASKNLMGSASRYRQVPVNDFGMDVKASINKGLDTLLEADLDEHV